MDQEWTRLYDAWLAAEERCRQLSSAFYAALDAGEEIGRERLELEQAMTDANTAMHALLALAKREINGDAPPTVQKMNPAPRPG